MRPIAIDVTLSVVCVSVCLSVTGAVYFSCMYSRCDMSTWIFIRIYGYDLDEPYNTGWTDRDAVWATESRGTKKPCIRWGSRSSYGKRQFFGSCPAHWKAFGVSAAVYAAKEIIPLSATAWSEKYYLILNNGTTCDAAVHQNFLTTCYYYYCYYYYYDSLEPPAGVMTSIIICELSV